MASCLVNLIPWTTERKTGRLHSTVALAATTFSKFLGGKLCDDDVNDDADDGIQDQPGNRFSCCWRARANRQQVVMWTDGWQTRARSRSQSRQRAQVSLLLLTGDRFLLRSRRQHKRRRPLSRTSPVSVGTPLLSFPLAPFVVV